MSYFKNNRSIQFQRHMKLHEKYPGFVCHYCHFRSDDKASYKKHIELHNNKPSPLVCVFCDRPYSNVRGLRRHCTRHYVSQFNILIKSYDSMFYLRFYRMNEAHYATFVVKYGSMQEDCENIDR